MYHACMYVCVCVSVCVYFSLSLYPVKFTSSLLIGVFALPRWIIILFFLMPSLTDLLHNHFKLLKNETQIHGGIQYSGGRPETECLLFKFQSKPCSLFKQGTCILQCLTSIGFLRRHQQTFASENTIHIEFHMNDTSFGS